MGVQRIQETSTASYGKSVEAAAAGNSSACRQRKCYRRHNADSGEHHDSMEGRKQNSTDTKNSLIARNDKDGEQETLVGAGK